MKRILNRPAVAVLIVAALLLSFGLVATAATLNVPADYSTITAALAAASPGDTITVAASYDPDVDGDGNIDPAAGDERFPIQVQKDNITIQAVGNVTISGKDVGQGKAVFVVGAYRQLDPATEVYVTKRISGVTIQGFTITAFDKNEDGDFLDSDDVIPDIGILVKEADNAKIIDNTIIGTLEGVRLLDATGCTVSGNTITKIGPYDNSGVEDYQGIGIFLEKGSANTLTNNTVTQCGLGLFVFESNNNTVTGDTYNTNESGGVVLNDSTGNTLTGLTVHSNGTSANHAWGVRFVFADSNTLAKSDIRDNTQGGIELLGSDDNTVEGNIVYNNGTANDKSDDAQIVITKGDKAIFTAFDDYNKLAIRTGFVEAKKLIYDKLDLLKVWLDELDVEFYDISQKLTSATQTAPQTLINSINYEMAVVQTSSHKLTRGFWDDPLAAEHLSPLMQNPQRNFSLEAAKTEFKYGTHSQSKLSYDELDWYEDLGSAPNFGLDYDADDDPATTQPTDDMSLDKLTLIDRLIKAIDNEVSNPPSVTNGWSIEKQLVDSDSKVDSLVERVNDLAAKGLITDQDKTALLEKLNAILGYIGDVQRSMSEISDHVGDAWTDISSSQWSDARTEINEAISAKETIYAQIARIQYKLCLVDLELPPFPEVNSTLVGKKEKPFSNITTSDPDDIGNMKTAIVGGLNGDANAKAILHATLLPATPRDWLPDDIQVPDQATKCSINNVIASNLIMTDLTGDTQIGMLIECGPNKIVNNAFTNEKVKPIDTETGYGEFHHMDVAIVLLASDCTIAYNTIEWVDKGIIRGGTWKRHDVQTEYTFTKLTEAAYWPEPGFSRTGCPNPDTEATTTYGASHFDYRTVAWVPVLSVNSADIGLIGFDTSQRIKHTRIALNFFEYVGTSIDIVDAESNVIDENLFYNCANGILFRAPQTNIPVPGDHRTGEGCPATYSPGGAGSNIVLEKNDYYSGVAIHNDSDLAVGANKDYTPPEGTVGHAAVFGLVTPPAAPAPNSYDNFGMKFKYVELGIEKYYPGDGATETLPPNLTFFYEGVVLPSEKPRNPSQIFNAPQPTCVSETFPAGWNLVSVPVNPVDPDPEAVFGDDVPFLYMWEWDGTQYVKPTKILPGHGYWIYLVDQTTLDVCGTMPTEDYTVNLGTAGWHMISTPTIGVYWHYVQFQLGTETKGFADAVNAGWIRPFFYPYDPTTGAYPALGANASDRVLPWHGYWVKTLRDGLTMVLPIEYSLTNPPVPPMSLHVQSLRAAADQPPAPPAPPKPASVDNLVVMNEPNPVRDVHTTTFKVMGGFVEAIRVRIYDLSGQLVYEAENPGNELTWHTEDLSGENLANGVYLYQVEVEIAGQWHVTKVQKLAIYR